MNIIRKAALLKKIGISKSTLYNRLNPKSIYRDQSFPKPFKIGLSCLGWDESEVDAWLESQKNQSRTSQASPVFKVIRGTDVLTRDIASNQQEAA